MILVLSIPLLTALACYALKNARIAGYVNLAGSIALAAASVPLVGASVSAPIEMYRGALMMDALSGYMMALVVFLALASSAYSIGYIGHELRIGLLTGKGVRRYYALLHLFVFTMLLVTLANNLALMWIAIEATTIVSALLIVLGVYKRDLAIEAAWKYLILCTVGITFALLGIFITYYASSAVLGSEGSLNWTDLRGIAGTLNPATMRLAFIFILIGYGTKAGLAPMHNWLPDAHSQAPSPISGLLSGILLNTAFYGIIRFVSIVEPSTGSSFTGTLLIVFGMVSLGVSSVFILVQDNFKRLLAYSSIEHMGIIAVGFGIGGPAGVYGALLHVLNHAFAKPLMFFTSGKIQAQYGTTRIERVNGVLSAMPFLGTLTFIGVLALAGTPPLSIFISEFTVLKAAADRGLWTVVALFLIFVVIVFYGMISGFGRMLFGEHPFQFRGAKAYRFSLDGALSNTVMAAMAAAVVLLGLFIPDMIDGTIRKCIDILGVK